MLIIDGHNLIPNIPGWSLGAIDDEAQLVELLKEYARARRKRVEVFFDGAPPGHAGVRPYGLVNAHFVRAGKTADEAIRQYLDGLKKAAQNASVVSSDRHVQAEARAHGAAVIPSDTFAGELLKARAAKAKGAAKARQSSSPPAPEQGEAAGSSGGALEQWYDLFGIDPQQAEAPIPLAPKKAQPARPKPARDQSPAKPARGAPARPRKHHGFPKKKP